MRYRCLSYTYCGFGSPTQSGANSLAITQCLREGVRILVDSGAHSFHNVLQRGKGLGKGLSKAQRRSAVEDAVDDHMRRYAEFIRWAYVNGRIFDAYVTLDAFKDCPWIYKTTQRFQKEHSIRPIPVYHGDQSIDWIKRYIDDGHKMIGISILRVGRNSKEALYRYFEKAVDYCYSKGIQTHGFAITGQLAFSLPWTSVDSMTYLSAAKNGKILFIDPSKRQAQVHITDRYTPSVAYGNRHGLVPSASRELRDYVERHGFDFDLCRRSDGKGSTERMLLNAKIMCDVFKAHTKTRKEYKRWDSVLNSLSIA